MYVTQLQLVIVLAVVDTWRFFKGQKVSSYCDTT